MHEVQFEVDRESQRHRCGTSDGYLPIGTNSHHGQIHLYLNGSIATLSLPWIVVKLRPLRVGSLPARK